MFWFKNFIICYGRLEGVSNSLRTVRCEYFFPPRSSSTLAEFLPSHLGGCQAATEGKFLALTLQQSERPAASDSKSSGCNFGPGNLGSGWSTRPKFTLFCCECKLCLWRKAKMGDGGSYCIPAIVPEKRGCYHWCLNCWLNICQTLCRFSWGVEEGIGKGDEVRDRRGEGHAHTWQWSVASTIHRHRHYNIHLHNCRGWPKSFSICTLIFLWQQINWNQQKLE